MKCRWLIRNSVGGSLKILLLILFLLFLPSGNIFSQNKVLDVGIRFQKSINLYYENGISVQYTNENLVSQRLFFGFSYVTSRLGSAWGTNAIKQDNFLLSSTYMFRHEKKIQPFVRMNAGYFLCLSWWGNLRWPCFLYTSDAAYDYQCV